MLIDEMTAQGRWLFRWRSYLPLVLVPAALMGLAYPSSSDFANLAWEFICPCVSFLGLAIRAVTVGFVPEGTSGRGTRSMRAETLNAKGMYSIVRNPLYLGNFLILSGTLAYVGSWPAGLIAVLAFWLYYERIIVAEEAYLAARFGESFRQWAAATPVFMPRLGLWETPALKFSMRSAIQREYHTLFGIVFFFTAIEFGRDLVVHHAFDIAPHWRATFLLGLAFYLVARFLVKRTRILNVAGR